MVDDRSSTAAAVLTADDCPPAAAGVPTADGRPVLAAGVPMADGLPAAAAAAGGAKTPEFFSNLHRPAALPPPSAVERPTPDLNSLRNNLGALLRKRAKELGLSDDNLMLGTSPEEVVGVYRQVVSGLARSLKSIADDLSILAGDDRDMGGGIPAWDDILGFHQGLRQRALPPPPAAAERPVPPMYPILDKFRALLRERARQIGVPEDDMAARIPPEVVVRVYQMVLSDLKINLKSVITELTIIAGDHIDIGEGIASAICARILEVPVEQKLPCLYLLDSIIKNIGGKYVKYFSAHLPKVFCETYRQVGAGQYGSMHHLYQTWSTIFPSSVLGKIEAQFSPSHGGTHAQPKYLEASHQIEQSIEMLELLRERDIEAGIVRGAPNNSMQEVNRARELNSTDNARLNWFGWKKYTKEGFAEAIATFFVVLFSCGATAISVDDPTILPRVLLPIVGGLLGVAQSFVFGHISGSHANPVVTICFACFKEFKLVQVPFYIVGQFSGALVASLSLRIALRLIKNLRTTTPIKFSSDAVLMEILVSMFMMFAKIASTDPRAYKKFGGIAVGSALIIGSFFAGSISGGSMNPFKSLGCAMTTGDYDHLWIFFVGPFIGSFIASAIYTFIFDPKGMTRSQVLKFMLKVWGLVSDRIEEMLFYRNILLACNAIKRRLLCRYRREVD